MPPLLIFLLVLFGLSIGSFLNVVIARLPKQQSIVVPRSHCPDCGLSLHWYDNIPLLSYLLLGGHCRFCKKPISFRYPLVELISGFLIFLLYLQFGDVKIVLLYFLFLASPLIAITFIDLSHKVIPNVISLPGIPAGLLVSLLIYGFQVEILWRSLIGMAAGGGLLFLIAWLYEKLRRREGIGMGDVKLITMLGAFLGWKGVFFVLMISSLLGSLTGLVMMVVSRKNLQYEIPYGPFLAAAALLYLFIGQEMIHFYFEVTSHLYN
ncbi:MAG: prepilin peptidase [Deltaproteobacteria bacterium]|nr:prepilin peptidase [Deltaproteobacteria bacterium]